MPVLRSTSVLISIHALREEGDPPQCCLLLLFSYFYPRPPRGGRLISHFWNLSRVFYFYPRPPRGGRRGIVTGSPAFCGISIHALREEGDLQQSLFIQITYNFYPRPPRGGRPPSMANLSTMVPFLSTPSARRATSFVNGRWITDDNFYPRPPRGGRPII